MCIAGRVVVAGLTIVCLAIIFVGDAPAALLPITNSSFEDPSVGTGWQNNPAVTGWTKNPASGSTHFMEYNGAVGSGGVGWDGTQHLGIGNYSSGSTEISFWQDTGVAWAAHTEYTMTVSIGNRGGGWSDDPAFFGLSTDSTRANIVGTEGSAWADNDQPEGSWAHYQYFTETGAVAPTGTVHVLVGLIDASGGNRALFDAVTVDAVTTVIPEPSTILIWSLLAGLGLIGWRRRRTK